MPRRRRSKRAPNVSSRHNTPCVPDAWRHFTRPNGDDSDEGYEGGPRVVLPQDCYPIAINSTNLSSDDDRPPRAILGNRQNLQNEMLPAIQQFFQTVRSAVQCQPGQALKENPALPSQPQRHDTLRLNAGNSLNCPRKVGPLSSQRSGRERRLASTRTRQTSLDLLSETDFSSSPESPPIFDELNSEASLNNTFFSQSNNSFSRSKIHCNPSFPILRHSDRSLSLARPFSPDDILSAKWSTSSSSQERSSSPSSCDELSTSPSSPSSSRASSPCSPLIALDQHLEALRTSNSESLPMKRISTTREQLHNNIEDPVERFCDTLGLNLATYGDAAFASYPTGHFKCEEILEFVFDSVTQDILQDILQKPI